MAGDFTVDGLTRLFQDKVRETSKEPDFQKDGGEIRFATGNEGEPLVKLALGNVPVDYDLWEGLRNPAMVGLFPAGLPEIWESYGRKSKQKVDEATGKTVFEIPPSYDFVLNNFRRAIIGSVMLPFSTEIAHNYVGEVTKDENAVSMQFTKMHVELGRILDKAVVKVAAEIASRNPDAVAIAMVGDTIRTISTEVVPQTHQGLSHGPSKGGNYAQKSVAALMGLGQFGVSRLIIRDEVVDGKIQRFAGPVRSIVIFDKNDLVTDGSDDMLYLTPAWRQFLIRLFDFTNADPEINQYRFCSHINTDLKSCTQCIDICLSNAQANSVPEADGKYADNVSEQARRFWQEKLQFDFEKCRDQQVRIRKSHADWFCGRCVTACVDRGIRRKNAVQNFSAKKSELTKKAAKTPVPA